MMFFLNMIKYLHICIVIGIIRGDFSFMNNNLNKNFLNLVSARLIMNMADSLLYMLVVWYISEKSPFLTSFAILFYSLSENINFIFGPIIDRYSHKTILLWTSIFQAIIISILTILLMMGLNNSFIIIGLIFLSSIFGNINYSVEESVVPTIVNSDELVKANSIMEIAYKILDSVFNGISGILISSLSMITLYQFNIILFIAPIIFIKNLKLLIRQIKTINSNVYNLSQYKQDLLAGLKFLWQKEIRVLVLSLVLINFCFVMTTFATPYLSRQIESSALVFGSFFLISGIAGIFGAGLSNLFAKKLSVNNSIALALFFQGFCWLLMIIFNQNDYVLFVMYFLSFLFLGTANILFASSFQKIVPVNLLGRFNTAIDSLITSDMPIDSLISEILLEKGINLFLVIMPYGLITMLVGVYYFGFNVFAKLVNE